MNKDIEKYDPAVSEAGRKMEAALAKLALAENRTRGLSRRGRLLFGLDLTSSREASLYSARVATAGMFAAIQTIGKVAVKLVYYRGNTECRAGAWHDDPAPVSRFMQTLACEAGRSQIARILRVALDEPEIIDAVIFIGDHCEDEADGLYKLAEGLTKRSIRLFVFHECKDSDAAALNAKPIFKRMAALTGGLYCEFKPNSAEVLRELLSNVAAFSSAGKTGVTRIGEASSPQARQLQSRLLALPAPRKPRNRGTVSLTSPQQNASPTAHFEAHEVNFELEPQTEVL